MGSELHATGARAACEVRHVRQDGGVGARGSRFAPRGLEIALEGDLLPSGWFPTRAIILARTAYSLDGGGDAVCSAGASICPRSAEG
jgi:hypothetical protein